MHIANISHCCGMKHLTDFPMNGWAIPSYEAELNGTSIYEGDASVSVKKKRGIKKIAAWKREVNLWLENFFISPGEDYIRWRHQAFIMAILAGPQEIAFGPILLNHGFELLMQRRNPNSRNAMFMYFLRPKVKGIED